MKDANDWIRTHVGPLVSALSTVPQQLTTMQLYIMLVNILAHKVYTVFYLVEVFWFSP